MYRSAAHCQYFTLISQQLDGTRPLSCVVLWYTLVLAATIVWSTWRSDYSYNEGTVCAFGPLQEGADSSKVDTT